MMKMMMSNNDRGCSFWWFQRWWCDTDEYNEDGNDGIDWDDDADDDDNDNDDTWI